MLDPYDILGVARSARLDEIKAAYRRACKSKHPDMGGSAQQFIELQSAYEFVLNDLKRTYRQQRAEAPHYEQAGHDEAYAEAERRWEKTYHDIDDELEELRRPMKRRCGKCAPKLGSLATRDLGQAHLERFCAVHS